jgi:release factor glutamine methyltransferase
MLKEKSIARALAAAAERLNAAGLNTSARQDTQILLMHVLGCDRALLLANPDRLLRASELEIYDRCISRRESHEPIQYITGCVEFYGLSLLVDRNVLIPRPETEHLVDALLARISHTEPFAIADIGTGSGAIAIALAHALPNVTITATDLSPAALTVARRNTEAHNLAGRIKFVETDLLAGLESERFDTVVSNPPYVAEKDRALLDRQVRNYEPSGALFAGASGFDIYERLIPQAERVLKPGGWLLMEIGCGQQPRIAQMLAGWSEVSFVPDLQGIPRVVCARRAPEKGMKAHRDA